METETIVVLFMSAVAVGSVVWLAVHSRRHPADANTKGIPPNSTGEAPKPDAQAAEKGAKTKKRRSQP